MDALSTAELEAIVDGSDQGYTPQAVDMARQVLSARGPADADETNVEAPKSRTGVVRAIIATTAIWLAWALVSGGVWVACDALPKGDHSTAMLALFFLPPAAILWLVAKLTYARWYRTLTVIAGVHGVLALARVASTASSEGHFELSLLVAAAFSLLASALLFALGTRLGWYAPEIGPHRA
jgi:hypothetical protein